MTATMTEQALETDVIAHHGPFQLMATGVVMTAPPTYDEWLAACTWVQQVEKASPFWVGDLLRFGEQKYGEMYAQVLDATDYAYQTCANAKYTCEAIPPERRRVNVPFAQHQEIAALPTPEEQDAWLARCEAEHLTRDELRIHLKAHKAAANGPTLEFWAVVRCADATDLTDVVSRMKAEGRQVHTKVTEV